MTTETRSIELFIESMINEGKDNKTIKQYESNIKRFAKFMEGQGGTGGDGGMSLVEKATQLDVSNFKKSSLERLKPTTVKQTIIHVSRYFDYLVSIGKAFDNPTRHIDAVSVEIKAPKWLNRNEQNALIRSIRSHGDLRELTIVTLLLHTGLRIQELCDVKVDDITITDRKGKVVVRSGKNSKRREIPLNVDCRKIIEDYLAKYSPTGHYLFDSQRSDSMTTRAVQHMIEKYRKFTGIDGLTAHSLRHTFCHELVSHGVSLDIVARLAGHTKADGTPNLEMTTRYTLPDDNDLANAVEELSWR